MSKNVSLTPKTGAIVENCNISRIEFKNYDGKYNAEDREVSRKKAICPLLPR